MRQTPVIVDVCELEEDFRAMTAKQEFRRHARFGTLEPDGSRSGRPRLNPFEGTSMDPEANRRGSGLGLGRGWSRSQATPHNGDPAKDRRYREALSDAPARFPLKRHVENEERHRRDSRDD